MDNAESMLDEIFLYGRIDDDLRKKLKKDFQQKCFGKIIWA